MVFKRNTANARLLCGAATGLAMMTAAAPVAAQDTSADVAENEPEEGTIVVTGIRAAIDSDASGAFQLGSGMPTTVNELLNLMREVTGRSLEVQYTEFRQGELHRTWCDTSKSREVFGFNPDTPLKEGLHRTWEWFLAQKH